MVAPPVSPEPPVSQSMPGEMETDRRTAVFAREILMLNPSNFIRISQKNLIKKMNGGAGSKKWRQKDTTRNLILHFFASIFLTLLFRYSHAYFLPYPAAPNKSGGIH